ncbi:WW domain containing oxidoreductase, isoform B, partial [Operophtera brumata]
SREVMDKAMDKALNFLWANAPLNHKLDKKYLSTIEKNKSILGDVIKVAQNRINAVLYGPTGEEITKDLELADKTCLITGANSGIGLEMTRCLSARGCAVLMACRNTYAAGAGARAQSMWENNHRLRLYETNLASLRSVKKCCDQILQAEKKIDIVILNAGVFGLPWTLTVDMLETSFQVNYLSQIYMLKNIEQILAPDARVVFITSESHRSLIPTEDVVSLPESKYTSIKAYNISKLCGILAMRYLSYCWLKTSKSVFCAHPGSFVKTRLCRNWQPYELLYTLMAPFSKNVKQAASTPLYCATSPALAGLSNLYFKECARAEPSELAQDSHLAFRLHDLTEDIIRDRTRILTPEEVKLDERI